MSQVYVDDIRNLCLANNKFREVIHTTNKSQLVLMSLFPSQEIGMEMHDGDQLLFIVSGSGDLVINEEGQLINWNFSDGDVLYIPESTHHNVINKGKNNLKLYTVYTPPQH